MIIKKLCKKSFNIYIYKYIPQRFFKRKFSYCFSFLKYKLKNCIYNAFRKAIYTSWRDLIVEKKMQTIILDKTN